MASTARLRLRSHDGNHSASLVNRRWLARRWLARRWLTGVRRHQRRRIEGPRRVCHGQPDSPPNTFAPPLHWLRRHRPPTLDAGGNPNPGWIERQLVDGAGLHPPDRAGGRRGRRQSPSSPCTTSTLHRRAANTPAILGQILERAPDQARPRAAGLVSGPKQIEHRRHRRSPGVAPRVLVRRMEHRRSRSRCRPRTQRATSSGPRSTPRLRACRRPRCDGRLPGCRA